MDYLSNSTVMGNMIISDFETSLLRYLIIAVFIGLLQLFVEQCILHTTLLRKECEEKRWKHRLPQRLVSASAL